MLTIQKLKELRQSSRDNDVIYKLLSTIIGECEQISKNPSNNEIIGILQKMYKDNKQTIEECPKDRVTQIIELEQENKFISQFLPTPLTETELINLIQMQLNNKAKMPDIMKYLSTNYKGRYDGKKAVVLINKMM